MINQEIAKIFYEIADYLQAEGVKFKPYAYRKAALTLESLKEDLKEIYKKGGFKALKEISGIGESMAQKIEEYIKTGKISYYEKYKKRLPLDLSEIAKVEGVGPKRAKVLYERLKIKTLKDLEKAAKAHKIAPLFGFGEKTERNILQGIEFLKKSKGRFLFGEIWPKVLEIYQKLKALPEVKKIDIAGSVRRKKETIGDVDLLIISKKPEKVMDFFCSLSGIEKIWGRGKTKSSIRLKDGFDVDLRILPEKSYGAGLQYFTGSKEHNIALRKLAIEKGFKLSEYGLFKGKKVIAGKSEKEIYRALGLLWIPPELRENRGEIEASLKGKLPKLIELEDIRGDFHTHSNWNGGAHSIKEMAQRAIEMGYQYLGISDHGKSLKIEHGLGEKELLKQREEILRLNEEFGKKKINFKILQGVELNILKDGSLDISDTVLKKLDYCIAGIHSHFKMKKKEMTERIIKAMKNPYVKIISHPTGRILMRRPQYEVDIEKIFFWAKRTNTALEINSFPERLDLDDINAKKAIEGGVKLIISSDAHQKDQLRFIEYGIYQARRGWVEKKDVINTFSLKKVLQFFSY